MELLVCIIWYRQYSDTDYSYSFLHHTKQWYSVQLQLPAPYKTVIQTTATASCVIQNSDTDYRSAASCAIQYSDTDYSCSFLRHTVQWYRYRAATSCCTQYSDTDYSYSFLRHTVQWYRLQSCSFLCHTKQWLGTPKPLSCVCVHGLQWLVEVSMFNAASDLPYIL